jgi:hypothetical protein
MDDRDKPNTKKKSTFEEDKNRYDSQETIKSQLKKSTEKKKHKAIQTKERRLRNEKKQTRITMSIEEALQATVDHGARMKEELAKMGKNTTKKKA